MKALIIAAGNGTRMQPVTCGRHKSLMKLLGLKIIERVILGAKEAGIAEFVIVTGYKGRELQKKVGDGSQYGVSITFVQNDNWEKANGISVLSAEKYFRENFVLLMSDHVFDPMTLVKIQKIKLRNKESVLAVDKRLDNVLDVADTTKVVNKRGTVERIHKNLDEYNAYDTGMFICPPYIFKVLKKTTGMGKNSLTNAMSVLVNEGKLRAYDIKEKFWADCDTYADIKFAEKKLLVSLTKSEDGIISKLFNRKVSTLITKLLIKTPLTPNMISFAILPLAVITFLLLSQGIYPWILLGGLLIQFMSIIDGCDGEVARLKYQKSKWGKWLDPILDRYVDTAVIAGLAFGYWNVTGNSFILPLAIFAMLVMMLDGYMPNKFQVELGKKLRFKGLRFKRDIRLLILALGAVTNQILFAFIIFLFFSQYKVIARLIAGKKITEKIKQTSVVSQTQA